MFRLHRRKPISEAFRDERLRGQMVALVEFVLADDSEKTGITFQARGMQCDSIQKMLDPIEGALGIFQRDRLTSPWTS